MREIETEKGGGNVLERVRERGNGDCAKKYASKTKQSCCADSFVPEGGRCQGATTFG